MNILTYSPDPTKTWCTITKRWIGSQNEPATPEPVLESTVVGPDIATETAEEKVLRLEAELNSIKTELGM